MLMLWVRLPDEEIELAIDYDEDDSDDAEGEDFEPLS
jgi:hypothetical protein